MVSGSYKAENSTVHCGYNIIPYHYVQERPAEFYVRSSSIILTNNEIDLNLYPLDNNNNDDRFIAHIDQIVYYLSQKLSVIGVVLV